MAYGRKITGGKYHKFRKKKKHSLRGEERKVKLSKEKKKVLRGRGGNKRKVLLSSDFVNLIDSEGKAQKVKIKNVLETPANRFLARQNILVKGALIETDLGKAKITNRPSQEGMVQGVLVGK